jgi:CheY-like chemotaxis protein
VVEDHAATRTSMARLLQKRGYEVTTAESLAEARQHLAAQSFAVVLSDLGLPDGHGHELAPDLRARPDMYAIALSGYGMEADIARSREAGYVAHLTKPVTIQALDSILGSIRVDQEVPA